MELSKFYNLMSEKGYYSNSKRLKFYLEEQLFKNVELKGKRLIDIGGGNGLFAYYAALNGAEKVVVMEPEFDGSSAGMINEFNAINSILGNLKNIEHTSSVLADYDREKNKFDIVLMHNSINHIDEDACIVLTENQSARDKYLEFFKQLQEICNPGCNLIICDCARHNFFGDLGFKNPFMSQIEWEKHQDPILWSGLLSKQGFKLKTINWTSPNVFGGAGKTLFSNKAAAYFTLSHFKMVMENQAEFN